MTQDQLEQALKDISTGLGEADTLKRTLRNISRLLQGLCSHPKTEYWSDPSGNNGGGLECKVCGKWL